MISKNDHYYRKEYLYSSAFWAVLLILILYTGPGGLWGWAGGLVDTELSNYRYRMWEEPPPVMCFSTGMESKPKFTYFITNVK